LESKKCSKDTATAAKQNMLRGQSHCWEAKMLKGHNDYWRAKIVIA